MNILFMMRRNLISMPERIIWNVLNSTHYDSQAQNYVPNYPGAWSTKDRLKCALIVGSLVALATLIVAAVAAGVFFGAPFVAGLAAVTFVASIALPTFITAAVATGIMGYLLGL